MGCGCGDWGGSSVSAFGHLPKKAIVLEVRLVLFSFGPNFCLNLSELLSGVFMGLGKAFVVMFSDLAEIFIKCCLGGSKLFVVGLVGLYDGFFHHLCFSLTVCCFGMSGDPGLDMGVCAERGGIRVNHH